MPRFRAALEQAGFSRPRMYIQGGNSLVDTSLPAPPEEKMVRELIRYTHGPDLVVIVRTGARLGKALRENPFRTGYDRSRLFFVSLAVPPPEQKNREGAIRDFIPEKLAIGTITAFTDIPGIYGRGDAVKNCLEKNLGVPEPAAGIEQGRSGLRLELVRPAVLRPSPAGHRIPKLRAYMPLP